MLGYTRGGQYIGNRYTAISERFWLTNIGCSGTETSIADCQYNRWGSRSCTHNTDVSVSCFSEVRSVSYTHLTLPTKRIV